MSVTINELKSAKRQLERDIHDAIVPLLERFRDELGIGIDSVSVGGPHFYRIDEDPALLVPSKVEVRLKLDI